MGNYDENIEIKRVLSSGRVWGIVWGKSEVGEKRKSE